ncbi:MAG: hypothetical protein COT17_05020 [Elusimicrobia bacterium CG08_land_8_20_14_0_20_51_18]|nr:MAG: hypothetical protein COT17_05020 [Elusimicrobia bacterium CG08_land_8_20_14_0_20_51_18]
MTKLVLMVEEKSASVFLETVLPKIAPRLNYVLITHEGKKDLENSLPRKLRAWREPNVSFLVLRDKDSEDCIQLKQRLLKICRDTGRKDTIVRIAVHCLESWLLGDLNAVASAYNNPSTSTLSSRAKFRNPDNLANANDEIIKIVPEYQKVSGARSIAPFMNLSANRSYSFNIFVKAIQQFAVRNYCA